MKERLRRCSCRHPLPVVTLSNVHSVSNKMNELMAKVFFSQSNLICLTQSWLKEGMSDPNPPGYTLIWTDRDNSKSQKSIGGRMCIFVDNQWATQYSILEKVCTHDYEIFVSTYLLTKRIWSDHHHINLCMSSRLVRDGNQDCRELQMCTLPIS